MSTFLIFFLLIKSIHSASILGVFFFPSVSHQLVYQPIWRELSLRGHKVTVITTDPINDPLLSNLTEINVQFTYSLKKGSRMHKLLSKDLNGFQNLDPFFRFMDEIVEAELNSTVVKRIINGDDNFDLIILEYYHPALFALSHKFQAPVIGVSSLQAKTAIHNIFGNPTHPYLYPNIFLSFSNKKLSLWQKIQSVAFNIYCVYYHHYVYTPRAQIIAEKYFGKDIPYVGDLERNMSLFFLNVNSFLYPPRPIVPSVIELGFMHIKPAKPLSEDLKIILDKSTQGVIYFSLGTNIKSIELSKNLQSLFIETFADLPYTVLWKYESEDGSDRKLKNVIRRKWWPQQDILAHPNVKLFITQGGLQSVEEAISRAVPLLALPYIVDQPINAQQIIDLGIGLRLDPTTLSKEEFKKTILEVAENSKFKRAILEIRDIAFDRPMTGLEKAVWWSEYVIRHKGAKYLKSPSADISWFEFLLLDVILTMVSVMFSVGYVLHRLSMVIKFSKKAKII